MNSISNPQKYNTKNTKSKRPLKVDIPFHILKCPTISIIIIQTDSHLAAEMVAAVATVAVVVVVAAAAAIPDMVPDMIADADKVETHKNKFLGNFVHKSSPDYTDFETSDTQSLPVVVVVVDIQSLIVAIFVVARQ